MTLAGLATSARAAVSCCRDHAAETLTEYSNLTKQIQRLESGQHVSLQAQPKRNHRDDDGDSDDNSHCRQDRTQFGLTEVSQSQIKNVDETHVKISDFGFRIANSAGNSVAQNQTFRIPCAADLVVQFQAVPRLRNPKFEIRNSEDMSHSVCVPVS